MFLFLSLVALQCYENCVGNGAYILYTLKVDILKLREWTNNIICISQAKPQVSFHKIKMK